MFLSFVAFRGNKCDNSLTAWYVRTLPPFCLKTLSGNFDKFVSPGRVRLC